MAAGPLSLHPALRPWYAAGLRHVYLDDEALAHMTEVRDAQLAEAKASVVRAARPDTRGSAGSAEKGVAVETGSSYTRRVPPRPQTNQQTKPDTILQSTQTAPKLPSLPNSQRTQGPQPSTLPPEQWPKQWREKLASTMATAKGAPVLWTYWALGEDLSGAPNGPRRDILRRIIGELNSARGTHCFWPIALPTDAKSSQGVGMDEESASTTMKLEANAPIFLAGLDILAPRICVIMGSAALRTILPNSTTGPYQQTHYGRMLLLVLPDMDMLLKDSERIPVVVAYLRTQLQTFMARR